jgi:hypothetical protein
MRVQHTINISSKMPRSFNNQNQQEAKMLAYVGVSEGVSDRDVCTSKCGWDWLGA